MIVQASLTDQLRLRIVDAAGNEIVVTLPRFSRTNADGSISVAIDKEGGRVDGPGGVSATVKPGTFPEGAVVTIKADRRGGFPGHARAGTSGAIRVPRRRGARFRREVPTQYVNVSVPAGPTDGPDDRWVVSMVSEVNGRKVLMPIDTAKVIDGKITTSSPPCPGVNASAVYGFHKADRPVGVYYGDLISGFDTVEVTVLGSPWVLWADAELLPFCFPVLSGRVTIVPNNVTITVGREFIKPTVDQVIATNVTRNNTKTQFTRRSLEFPEIVPGSESDRFAVRTVRKNDFNVSSFKLGPARPGFVTIALPVNASTLTADAIFITNLTTNQETEVPGNALAVKFKIAGGLNDDYRVHVRDSASGVTAPAFMMVFPSDLGPGNLVARAITKTIDPTQAEIDAYNATHTPPLTQPARTKVEIVNQTTQTFIEVPASSIIEGGFTFAFDGGATDQYGIVVTYANGDTNFVSIPMFQLTMTDPDGTVVRNIVLPAPPPDEPLNLGKLTNDKDPPGFVGDLTFLEDFDTSDFVSFLFSEAMDAESVKANLLIVDEDGVVIDAEVHLSNGNTLATLVPKVQLGLGKTYTIYFTGVTDRGGNGLPTDSLLLTTSAPRLVGSLKTTPGPAGIRDIQVRAKDVAGAPSV